MREQATQTGTRAKTRKGRERPHFWGLSAAQHFVGSLPPFTQVCVIRLGRVQESEQTICNAGCTTSRMTKGGKNLGTSENTEQATIFDWHNTIPLQQGGHHSLNRFSLIRWPFRFPLSVPIRTYIHYLDLCGERRCGMRERCSVESLLSQLPTYKALKEMKPIRT